MARPTTISDEQIMQAALDVFLERGPRATTAEIAARAGVSEGSIFKRWKTKDSLLTACMMQVPMDQMPWIARLPSRVGTLTLRENLEQIGMELIETFRLLMPVVLMHSSLGEEMRQRVSDSHVDPAVYARNKLAGYLGAERRAGRIRPGVDVDVMSSGYMGALFNFVHLQFVGGHSDPAPIADETYVRALVELMINGAATQASAASPRSGKRS